MGGSESLCEVARIVDPHAQINFQCQAGLLSTTAIASNTGAAIFQAGVIPQSADSFAWCSAQAFTDPVNCSSYLDVTALEAAISNQCMGKKSCQITDLRSFMPVAQAPDSDSASVSTAQIS